MYPPQGSGSGGSTGKEFLAKFTGFHPVFSLAVHVGAVASVTNGSTLDIRPGVGTTSWLDHAEADIYVGNQDYIQTTDGVTSQTVAYGMAGEFQGGGGTSGPGFFLPMTRDDYLRFFNNSGATRLFEWTGGQFDDSMGVKAVGDTVNLTNGQIQTFQPPTGKLWWVPVWAWGNATGVTQITDGTNHRTVAAQGYNEGSNARTGRSFLLALTNTLYLRANNNSGFTVQFYWRGIEFDASLFGDIFVSGHGTVAAGATTDVVQPPAGEEWLLTVAHCNINGRPGIFDGTTHYKRDAGNNIQHTLRLTNTRRWRIDNSGGGSAAEYYWFGFKVRK